MQSIFQIFSYLNDPSVSYGLIFLIGLLAGFHCIVMCGGIVAGYSLGGGTKSDASKFMPHIQYNLGRIISYSMIGAILGGIGSFFAISPLFQAVVLTAASLFMIVFGLSFFPRLSFLKRAISFLPSLARRYPVNKALSKKFDAPFFVGIFNSFMPCGPLQAIQVYALASGSAIVGGLSMGVYSIGTVPMLFIFGTILTSLNKKYMNKIFAISGVFLVLLGVVMGYRSVDAIRAAKGLVSVKYVNENKIISKDIQTVSMDLTYQGYVPNILYIKKGVPVRWVINVEQMSRCTDETVLHGYDIKKKLDYGENIIEFTPRDAGRIDFSCWMNMVWGKFVVSE